MSYSEAGSMGAFSTATNNMNALSTVQPPVQAPQIDLSRVSVSIESGLNINGVYPFVSVCLDNELGNELYKTKASTGGQSPVKFNEVFEFNLALQDKNRLAQGRPPAKYLTFYLYDVGNSNVPALGSAGVLLDTVRNTGTASGDFPVVNGPGKLALFVTAQSPSNVPQQYQNYPNQNPNFRMQQNQQQQQQQQEGGDQSGGGGKSWIRSDGAKVAAGVLGVGALAAAGVALAAGNKKKKNRKKQELEQQQQLQHGDDDDGYDDEDTNVAQHHSDEQNENAPSSSSHH